MDCKKLPLEHEDVCALLSHYLAAWASCEPEHKDYYRMKTLEMHENLKWFG